MSGVKGVVDGKTYSALVVDDCHFMRFYEERILQECGFMTTAVENGKQAFDTFNAGNSFDVVFMDMQMLVMNGIQATKELRAMGVKIKIYGVTCCESKADIEAFTAAGLDAYFKKPLDVDHINNVLGQLNK